MRAAARRAAPALALALALAVSLTPVAPAHAASGAAALYDAFRDLKQRLPFTLDAGVYLHYWQPLDADATLAAGATDGALQLYSAYLVLDKELDSFGAHVELRARDGGHVGPGADNPFLREHYAGGVWFQEAYAYWNPAGHFRVKAGKLYRHVGITWDDSFFGGLEYADGIKLNPDYGIAFSGVKTLETSAIALGYEVGYFLQSDGTSGGVNYGRTVARQLASPIAQLRADAPSAETQRDRAGRLITTLHNMLDGRFTLGWSSGRLSIVAGASGVLGSVRRRSTVDGLEDDIEFTQLGADLTVAVGPVVVYGEYLRQSGPGLRDAEYWQAGARASVGPVSLRVNASRVDYFLSPDVTEVVLQPGVTWDVGGGFALWLEYDEWQRRDPQRAAGFRPFDRSLDLVVGYRY